jgi:hypothetical protein
MASPFWRFLPDCACQNNIVVLVGQAGAPSERLKLKF